MKNKLSNHTSLEKASNVKDTLDWKIERIKKENLPVDTSLADYIAFSLENLEGQLNQLKALKREIKAREDYLKSQIDKIKVEGAEYLLGLGVDKLEGAICSSITVTKAKESKTIIDGKIVSF